MRPTPDVEKKPFEYFKLFVSDDMLISITEQTNIYNLQSKGAEKGILRKDIEKFIGTFFRIGLVRLPSQISYWETFVTYDGVSSWEETNLKQFFRIFVLETIYKKAEDDNDCIWKLRTWITELCQNFLKVSPEDFHVIDEIMVPIREKSLLH